MVVRMSGRHPPKTISPIVAAIQREAKRQGLTGYSLRKATNLPLRTVQRFLRAEGSPTLATVETIAKAVGVVLRAEREGSP
jgi:DNA-binding phage protein